VCGGGGLVYTCISTQTNHEIAPLSLHLLQYVAILAEAGIRNTVGTVMGVVWWGRAISGRAKKVGRAFQELANISSWSVVIVLKDVPTSSWRNTLVRTSAEPSSILTKIFLQFFSAPQSISQNLIQGTTPTAIVLRLLFFTICPTTVLQKKIFFQTSNSHLKILGATKVPGSKFHQDFGLYFSSISLL